MSKIRKIEFLSPIRSELQSEENNIVKDWSKCFICQKNSISEILLKYCCSR